MTMTILLPVISHVVDEIVLEFLTKNQYGDHLSTSNDFGTNTNNNNTDENNNNQSSQDEFEEVLNWADEPWTPCEDVEVPDWAKIEDPTIDDIKPDFVWAEDPWIQVPLVGIPSWMMLPGIDYPTEAVVPLDYTPVDNGEVPRFQKPDCPTEVVVTVEDTVDSGEDDAEFLASGSEVANWSAEPYSQLPLDVPRWALLPGIDFPVLRGGYNSPYWRWRLDQYFDSRRQFGREMFGRRLPTLREEQTVYNNYGQSMLCVLPLNFRRRYHRF